jgi:hypothetical protein
MAGVSILLMIVGLVLVFALSRHPKVVGIYLIVLSGAVLLGMGYFGVLPFALFLPAGIVALRYKPSRLTRYSGKSDDDDDERVLPGSGGGSPLK